MKEPIVRETFEILCLQAGDEEREAILFGDSISRVWKAVAIQYPSESYPTLDIKRISYLLF